MIKRIGETVVSLFDKTGRAVTPWMQAGYDAILVDGQHPEGVTVEYPYGECGPRLTKVGMWLYPGKLRSHAMQIMNVIDDEPVAFVFSFSECTELTTTGARWWPEKAKKNPLFQEEALDMCKFVQTIGEMVDAPWMLENPAVSRINTMWRGPDYTFHPYELSGHIEDENKPHYLYPDIYPAADRYTKNTGLWLGNGAVPPEKRPRPPVSKDNPGWKKTGGKSLRTKNIRSATPESLALAMFAANHKETKN